MKTPTHIYVLRRQKGLRGYKMKNEITEEALCPSHNSGYAVWADYRPHQNCPSLCFGQLRIAAIHWV